MLVYSVKPFGWLTGGVLHVATPLMAAQYFFFWVYRMSFVWFFINYFCDGPNWYIPLMYKHNHFFILLSFTMFYCIHMYTILVILRLIPLIAILSPIIDPSISLQSQIFHEHFNLDVKLHLLRCSKPSILVYITDRSSLTILCLY